MAENSEKHQLTPKQQIWHNNETDFLKLQSAL